MDFQDISQAITTTSAALVLTTFVFVLARRYLRLRHISGPFFAKLTDFWYAIKIWRGEEYYDFIQDLHSTYGPVVRWGPNRVSFAQPEAIPAIYGTRNVLPKVSTMCLTPS